MGPHDADHATTAEGPPPDPTPPTLAEGTRFRDLFAALMQPFAADQVKVRTQAGRQLHYITARTAMNRLDEVLGPENWWDDYTPAENSVLCRLTVRLPDGTTLTKQDAGGYAGMADAGDDDKSGFSDAFKRACGKFGVARYLYRDGVPGFVRGRAPEPAAARQEQPQQRAAGPQRDSNGHRDDNGNGRTQQGGPPRTGKAMFAWTRDQEQRHEVGLLKYLNSWSKLQDFPGRMVDWDADQVALAYAEATRKLRSIQHAGREPGEEG